MRVAFTKASGSDKYELYKKFILQADPKIECVDLINVKPEKVKDTLKCCSGLVVTGGPDVDPKIYGKEADTALCTVEHLRDTIDINAILAAVDLKMPVLAICRGEQVLNVALGGTLIVDIPTDKPGALVHRIEGPKKCMHEIKIDSSSFLFKITGVKNAIVNSLHHQAVDLPADLIRVVATSADGVAEAIEWSNPEMSPFLIAVQWHPERLPFEHPLAGKLAKAFVENMRKYHLNEKR